jgi:hypothetical protein
VNSAAHMSEGTSATEVAGKDLLWFIAEGTAGTVGEQFFQCLAKHLARAFRADVAFVAEVVPEDRERARFLACWEGAGLAEPVEYRLAGTPCAEVRHADVVSYADGVRERFPEDEMVVELGLDSYLAVALRGADGAHIATWASLPPRLSSRTPRRSPRFGSSPPAPRRSSSAGGTSARCVSGRRRIEH